MRAVLLLLLFCLVGCAAPSSRSLEEHLSPETIPSLYVINQSIETIRIIDGYRRLITVMPGESKCHRLKWQIINRPLAISKVGDTSLFVSVNSVDTIRNPFWTWEITDNFRLSTINLVPTAKKCT